ncbi:Lsr2-like DNA bridging protein [Streptomyces phage TunaTartare]|uniref:Lsr2-like DNA bridging protein n=1 Tax=Streptomyces phage TunaTartare TaxID=2848887 RepID=A0A8F2E6T9_9CAUD|nr:Lsr2-like DNA bridging protein [Streptomyces phage TunaTartare]QWT30078.1 Lsr2-like DNA bridging protein [Streptomyces phage TunaTartare]
MPTERAYLVSKGLAKEGRGRFSAEAKAALEEARQRGVVFDLTPAEIAKQERQSKPQKVRKAAPETPKEVRPSQDMYDAKAVRAWGEQTGAIEKGKRGKLPTALINAFLAANKPAKQAVVRRKAVKREAVRSETVGWTHAKRKASDPEFISEPLVAVMTCGCCNRGVSFCGCKSGPVAPKYLGGDVLLLTRPEK